MFVLSNYTLMILKQGVVLSKLEAFFMESSYDVQVSILLLALIEQPKCEVLSLEMEETCDSCAGNKHLIKIHRIFPDIYFLLIQCCLLLEQRIQKK